MNKKYSTLLIDLDDTLLDFGKAEDCAITRLMEDYGIPVTDENKRLYVELNKSLWKALEKGELTRQELWEIRFVEFFKAMGVEADGKKANSEFMDYISQGSFIIDGALETCEKLHKSYRMYIITNGSKKSQRGRLTNSPILKHFDGVFISEEIGHNKPSKEYFDYVFSQIEEQDRSRVLVIGDSLSSDIAGAVNYGLDSCWLCRGEEKENSADCIIYDIRQLSDIL